MHDVEDLSTVCKNCNSDFQGNYCSTCGQKRFDRSDFNLKEFIKEFADDVFDFDSKIFHTLKLLLLKPGKLTIDFIQGKQKSYISPVKLYLVVITINFLVYSYFDNYSPIESSYLMQFGDIPWLHSLLELKIQQSALSKEAFYHELNQLVNNSLSIILYFLIFVFAVVLKLYYYNSGKYYIEHLIFCLYFMAFGFLRDTIFLPLYMYNKDVAAVIAVSSTLLYFYLSIKPVYGNTGLKRVYNSLILYGIFFCLFGLSITISIAVSIIIY